MSEKSTFSQGTLVKLDFQGQLSEYTYAVQAYSEHYGGYLLVAPDGRVINAKEENVVVNDDDTYIFDLKKFKNSREC